MIRTGNDMIFAVEPVMRPYNDCIWSQEPHNNRIEAQEPYILKSFVFQKKLCQIWIGGGGGPDYFR